MEIKLTGKEQVQEVLNKVDINKVLSRNYNIGAKNFDALANIVFKASIYNLVLKEKTEGLSDEEKTTLRELIVEGNKFSYSNRRAQIRTEIENKMGDLTKQWSANYLKNNARLFAVEKDKAIMIALCKQYHTMYSKVIEALELNTPYFWDFVMSDTVKDIYETRKQYYDMTGTVILTTEDMKEAIAAPLLPQKEPVEHETQTVSAEKTVDSSPTQVPLTTQPTKVSFWRKLFGGKIA